MGHNYKFRGWDAVGSKGWVYGDLVHNLKITKERDLPRVMVGGYEVDPESVGLFTGLYDKNGKEIFEGDIIAYKRYLCDDDPEISVEKPITFTDGVLCIDEDWCYPLAEAICDAEEFDGVEIIGNVYERGRDSKVR